MTWAPDICIYHGGCDDGFGAAWVIAQRWPDCKFVPGRYGAPPPDVTGQRVIMVDFSYGRTDLLAMAEQAHSTFVLDHHKTAAENLHGLPRLHRLDLHSLDAMIDGTIGMVGCPRIVTFFDMEASGAVLAWRLLNSSPFSRTLERPLPLMLALIEDRDLWRFIHGDKTRQFSAALRTYPQDFTEWTRISENVPALVGQGEHILRAHRANIAKFVAESYTANIAMWRGIPVCNVPYHYASDVADALIRKYPDAHFAAAWFQRGDGKIQVSLRSENSRADVSEVAKTFGGGGHRNAAGFEISPSVFRTLVT